MKRPRLARMAAIIGGCWLSTWAGMAYAKGDVLWYLVLGGLAAVVATWVYFQRIPPNPHV